METPEHEGGAAGMPQPPQPQGAQPRPRTVRNSIWNKKINRRNSREWALQMLFKLDVTPPETSLEDFFAEFWTLQADILAENEETGPAAIEDLQSKGNKVYRVFAEQLVTGVWEHRDEIDAKIEGYLANWSLSRIGGVERNVLRIAILELFFRDDTPPIVVINEAVDIVKYFSMRESGKFINGVLDRASRDVTRSLRDAPPPPRWKRK